MEKEYTFVLFGKEAIQLYEMSLNFLLSSSHVDCKVGAYNDVKKFVKESQNWNGFKEINEKDYLQIKKHNLKSSFTQTTQSKKRKKFSILNLFR